MPSLSPDISWGSTKRYFSTRLSTLIPRKEYYQGKKDSILNPFKPLRLLNRSQWNLFMLGFWGWTWDSFDFFCLSLNVPAVAKSLNVSNKDITWGISLVLMLKPVGAVIFGLLGDRYGRKWPFIFNLVLLIVIEIGTGFVSNFHQLLGVRALFGVAMGGMYGNAAAVALEDSPIEARGILSGILQEGYAFGNLLAVAFQRAFADKEDRGWRELFWFSAGPPVIFIVWRYFAPETDAFKTQADIENIQNFTNFRRLAWKAIRQQWLVFIYMVVLMAAFAFMSHGSQDLYPTLLTAQYDYSPNRSTVTNAVGNLGALLGGIFFGHMSDYFGRRLCIMICCVYGGALIYPWAFISGSGVNAGVFFLQLFVQGGWGIVPVHLTELSRDSPFRSFVVGTVYQLGQLCASASSTIEATIGERFPIYKDGKKVGYDYSKVMAIFIGCVFGFVFIVTFLGPENKGKEFLSDSTLEKKQLMAGDEKAETEVDSVVSSDVGRAV